MFVAGAYIPEGSVPPADRRRWPFTVPAVGQLLAAPLTFDAPVTFLVGDNGSGKSTLVEAIAEGFGLDAYGGRASRKYTPSAEVGRTPLGEVLRLDATPAGSRMLRGPRLGRQGFFLRAETAFQMTERLGGRPGYWDEDTSTMSHGEGFLAVFDAMMGAPGFYVMDEPESALSFTSSLSLVERMYELGASGAQVVCATHSPILASTPGADIVEIGPWGFRRVAWQDLQLVEHWRTYLDAPAAYLRHLIADHPALPSLRTGPTEP
ncbi:MAG: AAA family ATPase [Actinocatenispora sp.]